MRRGRGNRKGKWESKKEREKMDRNEIEKRRNF